MAHAIWHIDPSFIGKYWKDKLMGGALATQEGLIDPMLDRVVGTAPGIPVRPFFGGESGRPPAQPTRPSTPTGPRSVADIVRNFETPASIGFTMPPSTPVTGPPAGSSVPSVGLPTTPRAIRPANLSPREQAIAAQVRASGMADGRSTGMNLATPPADPAFVRMMQGQPNPFEPSGPFTSVPSRVASPAASTADEYLLKQTLPRVSYSGAGAMGPGGLPPSVRETGAHAQQPPPARVPTARPAAGPTGDIGKLPKGPFKEQIKEAAGDTGPAATEQEKLRRMLKMMFLSDLIQGTEAPNPDYYSAVSVGPASRAFAPLPSMFRGR